MGAALVATVVITLLISLSAVALIMYTRYKDDRKLKDVSRRQDDDEDALDDLDGKVDAIEARRSVRVDTRELALSGTAKLTLTPPANGPTPMSAAPPPRAISQEGFEQNNSGNWVHLTDADGTRYMSGGLAAASAWLRDGLSVQSGSCLDLAYTAAGKSDAADGRICYGGPGGDGDALSITGMTPQGSGSVRNVRVHDQLQTVNVLADSADIALLQSESLNAGTVSAGSLTSTTGLVVDGSSHGPLVERVATSGRYGVSHDPSSGSVRMYAADGSGSSSLSLSFAKAEDGSYRDVLNVQHSGDVSVVGSLSAGGSAHRLQADGLALHSKSVIAGAVKTDAVLVGMASGLHAMRPDGRWSHFPWSDGKNYVRGDTIMDDSVMVSGAASFAKGMQAGNVRVGNTWAKTADATHWEIANDTGQYKALMLVGNKSGDGKTRKVAVWDQLDVNGSVNVTKGMQAGNARVGGNWTNTADATHSEIANDTDMYKALLLVGNKSGDGKTRKVAVWDQLDVSGKVSAPVLCLGSTCLDANGLAALLSKSGVKPAAATA